MKPDSKLEESQIDPDHANEPIANIPLINTYLNVNKIHAIQLAIAIGYITAQLYTISPLLSILLLTDLLLASLGYSLIANLTKIHPPNYAFIYTIRTDPWYYTTTTIITYILFTLLL